ncbi:hypothetical protein CFC21_092281 [Triticum aestivum]|uniref:BHLH domain-containing protein n=3 Tax=Triticum TaxID=4564 RepID=A0A9R0ZWX5_TRITD|nr:transcription factor RHD6-like [Triticum dicoccoides]XP_044430231.1 transcription factor RHD6-like [Triticum aestivum]KAF7089276.1 hypothetical protein CFC21_092281 [Triticum aestivum]VAI85580.1 unnamed protein product [Triticum turgidum subsp. durum]
MALVGQPATFCYDGFVGDGVPAFMDAGGVGFGYGYDHHSHLLEEECLLGSHAHGWELPPTGNLGAEAPGSVNAFGGHDVGWTNPAGRLSSSSASSSVLTFDNQGEDNYPAATWMDAADQLSYSPSTAAAATALAGSFSFEGCGGNGRTAASPSHKRPRAHAEAQQGTEQESTTLPKKQCGGDRKSAVKPSKTSAPTSSAKDPQSDAAKTRRERIGERLRVLQELVPNGNKVDMVTMLDKAITYVKFMQLQLTVLETDAFWPAQGGEAPEISQVKAALDAIILSSSQQLRQWS